MVLRRISGALLLGFALLGLAACAGQPYRPFGRDGEAAGSLLVRPLTGTSVAVVPVPDLPPPLALALAEALADGLAAAEVPARVTPAGGLPGEHHLFGQVLAVAADPDSDTLVVDLSLELRDSGGNPAMVRTVSGRVPGALWTSEPVEPQPLAEAAARLVGPALPAFAAAERALVPVPSGEPEGLAEGSAAAAPPPPPSALAVLPSVAVPPAEGSPGGAEAGEVLAAALRAVLRDVGVPLAPGADRAGAVVVATVTLKPVPAEQRDFIRVVWSVRDPGGAEIGQVAQENLLPRGYAEQNWADLSYLIAGAAVDGVVPLLRRMPSGS